MNKSQNNIRLRDLKTEQTQRQLQHVIYKLIDIRLYLSSKRVFTHRLSSSVSVQTLSRLQRGEQKLYQAVAPTTPVHHVYAMNEEDWA